jgi:DNA-binding NarL/FixJ family response regulator
VNTFSPSSFRGPAPLDWLTPRERQLLDHVLRGFQNKEIASALQIHAGTVGNGMSALFRKVGVATRSELIIWAAQNPREADLGKVYSRGLHKLNCACDYCGRLDRLRAA